MAVYYNEWERFPAQWLRNLIKAGYLPEGDVDERDIRTISADDLKGYAQCHFFAGIGGWPLALKLAGWPDDRPVWTGSCPCQPFSSAGKQKGQADERHLWPTWYRLIRESKPATIFGEQVASAIAYGWWDEVANDLETEGYACGAAVLPACAVGAPHQRKRLWFVANSPGIEFRAITPAGDERRNEKLDGFMANPSECGRRQRNPDAGGTREESLALQERSRPADSGTHGDVGFTQRARLEGFTGDDCQKEERRQETRSTAETIAPYVECADGKIRPIEPSIPLLAHGVPNRVGLLRGFGNAIVPKEGAEFIEAFMECRP